MPTTVAATAASSPPIVPAQEWWSVPPAAAPMNQPGTNSRTAATMPAIAPSTGNHNNSRSWRSILQLAPSSSLPVAPRGPPIGAGTAYGLGGMVTADPPLARIADWTQV